MVINTLCELLEAIKSGELLPVSIFHRYYLDDLLESRDTSKSFESEWLSLHTQINAHWKFEKISTAQQKQVDELRELVFIKVSHATNNHEIASYISDDFELIAKSISLGMSYSMAEKLLLSYIGNEIANPQSSQFS